MARSITRQIIDLQNKTSSEMRSLYRSLFDGPMPYNASHLNLRTKIAYRIQELAIGGLSDKTKNKLEKIANEKGKRKNCTLMVGTKIHRRWKGVIYEVEVLKKGFEYNGQHFNSLSAVAQKITGTKWNGPKFFNVKQEAS